MNGQNGASSSDKARTDNRAGNDFKTGSRATDTSGQVGRTPARWAAALWQHTISLVLADIQRARPRGRWAALARLAFARKEYTFLYSRLLRRSADTGHFVFNVQASPDALTWARLFRHEMVLPVGVTVLCRTLAAMVSGTGGVMGAL